jgi:hypothetical protein
MANSEILTQKLFEGTEENPQGIRVDTPETSRSQMINANHSTVMYACQCICVFGGRTFGNIIYI